MRFREFLVEYSREKTAAALGDKLIAAYFGGQDPMYDEHINSINVNPAKKALYLDRVLTHIEGRDPTPNKEYSQWLARMYANGDVKLEDLNRHDWLGLYDLAKKRRILKLEDRDINKFKTYQQFESAFALHYPLDELRPQKEIIGAEAKKVFEDDQVLVVIPENEAAACKYGAGTRWCTAATRGENYFNHYNSEGPLYIIIPKKPEYPGEKYQLHFDSLQFMNKDDNSINLEKLLQKYHGLREYFMQHVSLNQQNNYVISLQTDETLQNIIDKIVKKVMDKKVSQILFNMADDDGEYYDSVIKKYPAYNNRGDPMHMIDWDKISEEEFTQHYLEYSKYAKTWLSDITNILNSITPDVIRKLAAYDDEHTFNVHSIPDLLVMYLDEYTDKLISRPTSTLEDSIHGISRYIHNRIDINLRGGATGEPQWNVD